MRTKILSIILVMSVLSCDMIDRDIKAAFSRVNAAYVDLTRFEENRIDSLYDLISLMDDAEFDKDHSNLVYHDVKRHSAVIDSVFQVFKLRNKQNDITDKILFSKRLNSSLNRSSDKLRNKLNQFGELEYKAKVDSIIGENFNFEADELQGRSLYAVFMNLNGRKYEGVEAGSLVLQSLYKRMSSSKLLKKDSILK